MSGSKYRILAHLRGGDATETALVSIVPDNRLAVLKHLKLGSDAEPQVLERFAAEAILCKRLDHPNLAKLLEAGQDEGAPVLVFEYLDGVSLARIRSRALKQSGGVPIPITLRIVQDIAEGLRYAHDLTDENEKPLRLVHRDVSPDNVMVTYDGQVKLADFGMASTVQSTKVSREERVKGNVAYMAPEQARAEFALDARADLFALGVIFWELLTGKRIWEGLSEVDVLARLSEDTALPSAKSLVPEIPDPVDALCSQALIKVRDERIDSAGDFVTALKKIAKKNPELRASSEELSKFVSALFADERAKMHAIIEAGPGSMMPIVGATPAAGSSPFVDADSDPKLRFGKERAPEKRIVEVVEIPAQPSSDSKFGWIMAGAAVVVLAIAGTIVAMQKPDEPKPVEAPFVAPTRPTAAPEPSASTEKEPEEVTIEIRVTPPEAKISVDGAVVSNPYHTRVVPAAFKHSIRLEAEGFESRSMSLSFDKERSLEIALTPEKKTPPGQRRPAPPPPPPAPAP